MTTVGGGAAQPEATMALRAYRFALEPTDAQLGELARFAGAARWAFNHALAANVAGHRQWRQGAEALMATGVELADAP